MPCSSASTAQPGKKKVSLSNTWRNWKKPNAGTTVGLARILICTAPTRMWAAVWCSGIPMARMSVTKLNNTARKNTSRTVMNLCNSPHIGKAQLWETSGHLTWYEEYMYSSLDIDQESYFLKPMNCPFHIMIYKNSLHSYRELPLRWAEWGTVYRYERSGVLHGMLRVRGFTQDDAHIFCSPNKCRRRSTGS